MVNEKKNSKWVIVRKLILFPKVECNGVLNELFPIAEERMKDMYHEIYIRLATDPQYHRRRELVGKDIATLGSFRVEAPSVVIRLTFVNSR